MKQKAIKSVKEVFESDNVIITNILQGLNGMVRIDAKTRFPNPDKSSFFSKWVSEKYANKLSNETYGKNVRDFSVYSY